MTWAAIVPWSLLSSRIALPAVAIVPVKVTGGLPLGTAFQVNWLFSSIERSKTSPLRSARQLPTRSVVGPAGAVPAGCSGGAARQAGASAGGVSAASMRLATWSRGLQGHDLLELLDRRVVISRDQVVIGQHETAGGIIGLLLAVGLQRPELRGVGVGIAVKPDQRRPVHAGRNGQQIVQDGRGAGVVARGKHAQGPDFMDDRVMRRLPQGLLIKPQSSLVIALLEGRQGLIEKLVGLGRLRRFRGGVRPSRRLPYCSY